VSQDSFEFADVIFDLDGTLVDSAPGIVETLRRVIAAHGLQVATPLDESVIGPPLRRVLEGLCGGGDEELLSRLAGDFRVIYDSETCQMSTAYPGIRAAIRRLHDAGARLHVATNKRMAPTHKILSYLGWAQTFHSVYSTDAERFRGGTKANMVTAMVGEQRIDPATTLIVGDSIDDLEAAQLLEIRFRAAGWGYGTRILLERYPTVTALTDPAEL